MCYFNSNCLPPFNWMTFPQKLQIHTWSSDWTYLLLISLLTLQDSFLSSSFEIICLLENDHQIEL